MIAEGSEGLAGRGIQSQDVRFKANADGITPAAPVSDSEWNTWSALTSAGYSTENKYLWRCTRTVYVDGNGVTDTTYVVDGPTVWGTDGQTSFVIDIDNEMDAVSVLSSGIASEKQSWTINVKSFYGSTQITEDDGAVFTITEITGNDEGLVSTNVDAADKIKSGKLVVSSLSGVWTKSGAVRITIQVSHATYGTRTAVFTLKPVFPGEDGKPVPVYQLLLSQTEAAFSRSDSNTLTPTSIKIKTRICRLSIRLLVMLLYRCFYTVRFLFQVFTEFLNSAIDGILHLISIVFAEILFSPFF